MATANLRKCQGKCNRFYPPTEEYFASEDSPLCRTCTVGWKSTTETPFGQLHRTSDPPRCNRRKTLEALPPPDLERGPRIFQYMRVSTNKQVESGLGLDAQQAAITPFAQKISVDHNVKDGERFVEEGVSAAKVPFINRPRGRVLNSMLKEGDHVVFAVHDRAFRDLNDFTTTKALWDSRGIKMHFANLNIDGASPVGEMVLSIMMVVAQWESKCIAERTTAARETARAGGWWVGKPPLGFKAVRDQASRKRRLRLDHYLAPWMRLAGFYRRHGMGWPGISDAFEVLHARRENRAPIRREHHTGRGRYFTPKRCEALYRNLMKHHYKTEEPVKGKMTCQGRELTIRYTSAFITNNTIANKRPIK